MHSISIFSLLFAVGLASAAPGAEILLEKRGCTSNNCLRQLKNAKNSLSASSFCSSLIRPTYYSTVLTTATEYTTVTSTTPQAATTTAYVVTEDVVSTSTSTIIVEQYQYKRTASPPLVFPTYASACGTAAITSACSCLLTGTAAPRTTTIPTTVTVTSTLPATFTAPTNTQTFTATTTTTATDVTESTVTVTYICGVRGNANIGQNYLTSFGYPNEASSCAEGCPLFVRGTLSFSYNFNSKVCYCYGGTVAEVSHSYAGSELYFYDIGCSSYEPRD